MWGNLLTFLDGEAESRLGTACMCACARLKSLSPLPYRPATLPRIMCVLCVLAYVFKHLYACVCVRAYLLMYEQTPLSNTHFAFAHKRCLKKMRRELPLN